MFPTYLRAKKSRLGGLMMNRTQVPWKNCLGETGQRRESLHWCQPTAAHLRCLGKSISKITHNTGLEGNAVSQKQVPLAQTVLWGLHHIKISASSKSWEKSTHSNVIGWHTASILYRCTKKRKTGGEKKNKGKVKDKNSLTR